MTRNRSSKGTVFEGIKPCVVRYDDLGALYTYLNGVFQYLLIHETNQETRPELKKFVLDLIDLHGCVMDGILARVDERIIEYNDKREEREKILEERRKLEEKLRALDNETQSKYGSMADEVAEDDFDDPLTGHEQSPFAMGGTAGPSSHDGPEIDPFAEGKRESPFDFDLPDDVKEMLVETDLGEEDSGPIFSPDEFDLPIRDKNDSRSFDKSMGFGTPEDDPFLPGGAQPVSEGDPDRESTGMTDEMVDILDHLEQHDEELEEEQRFAVNAFNPDNPFGIDNIETFDDLVGTTDTFQPIFGDGGGRRQERDDRPRGRDDYDDRSQGRGSRGGSFQGDNDASFLFDDDLDYDDSGYPPRR